MFFHWIIKVVEVINFRSNNCASNAEDCKIAGYDFWYFLFAKGNVAYSHLILGNHPHFIHIIKISSVNHFNTSIKNVVNFIFWNILFLAWTLSKLKSLNIVYFTLSPPSQILFAASLSLKEWMDLELEQEAQDPAYLMVSLLIPPCTKLFFCWLEICLLILASWTLAQLNFI